MTATIAVDYRNQAAQPRLNTALAVDASSASVAVSEASRRLPGQMPFAVPREQLYYWSKVWQDGVAVAHAALANGDFVDFASDDPDDVVRWLFEVDDD